MSNTRKSSLFVKSILLILFISFIFMSNPFTIEVLANDEEVEVEVETEPKNELFEDTGDEMDAGLPNATIDDASNWAERKGFELVGLLQKFVQPFAIIIFIGCAILTLVGAFGNGHLVSRGILGMVISLVMYAVVIYAPEIMDVFLGWINS